MGVRVPPKGDEQLELFSAMLSDIATRDARETMEVPFLSISKSPRFEPIRFKSGDTEVVVTGGKPYGIANIWDWDLMLWLLSQTRQAIDNGDEVSRKIRFHRKAFLKDARRAAGGEQYRRLEESIGRLANTNVFTTIRPKPGSRTTKFTWIESFDLERDERGQMTFALVVIPEWLFTAVCDQSKVLTLDRDFFLLTGGLERWLYRFVRKGAGKRSEGWAWKMRTLHERSSSTREFKYFARDIRKLVGRGELLGYRLSLERSNGEELVRARPVKAECRESVRSAKAGGGLLREGTPQFLRLRTDTYARARSLVPEHDVYALVELWKEGTAKNQLAIRDADSAFLAWCKTYGQNHR